MRKFIFFRAIALWIFAATGCEKEHNILPLKMVECNCEEDAFSGLLQDRFAIVKYDNSLKSAVLIGKMRNCGSELNENANDIASLPFLPCEGSVFPSEYKIDGLEVKVSGVYKSCKEWDNHKYFIIKISSIKKYN